LAITKFKSLFTCYEFAAWLICLTKFLGRMISSSISIGKFCASGSPRSVKWLGPLSRDGQGAVGCPMRVMPTPSRMMDLDSARTYLVRAPQTRHSCHQVKSCACGSPLIYACLLLLISLSSPRPQQRQGVGPHSGAGRSVYLKGILNAQPLSYDKT